VDGERNLVVYRCPECLKRLKKSKIDNAKFICHNCNEAHTKEECEFYLINCESCGRLIIDLFELCEECETNEQRPERMDAAQ
jgi:hypothetical protein